MAPNRITRSGAASRARALAAVATALAVTAALLAGCGGGSSSTAASSSLSGGSTTAIPTPMPSPEESADAAILDAVLSRQEAAVDAFAAVIPHLAPRLARMASYFRAQEQEHVDAVVKELRGLKSPPEPKAEAIEVPAAKTETERLVFLYEVESVTIGDELSAIAGLEAAGPRSTLAATVANQAQHLTLLRRALGAGPLAAIPSPFESGSFPPPLG